MCNFRLINRNICEKLNSHAFSLGHVTHVTFSLNSKKSYTEACLNIIILQQIIPPNIQYTIIIKLVNRTDILLDLQWLIPCGHHLVVNSTWNKTHFCTTSK